MLWLLGKLSGPPEGDGRKKLVLACCECARLAPAIKNPEWEAARLACLDTAERWAKGEATIEELRKTRKDADTYAAAAYTATAAAATAASAAYAAYAADAYAATAAATAAYAAAYAADAYAADAYAAAAYAAARKQTLKQCADIVRKHYPPVPVV